MKEHYSHITIVLDRSGSMESIATDTIGGFNKFLADQQATPGEATLTLVQFDNEYEIVHDLKRIHEVKPLTDQTFVPRGSTALLDAVGRTIIKTGKDLAALEEQDRPSKVIFVILTDGLENASREFSASRVSESLTHQREVYKWEFVFIGANQDAIATGRDIGIPAEAALTYQASPQGTVDMLSSLSANVRGYRTGSARSMAWSKEDRDRQTGEEAES